MNLSNYNDGKRKCSCCGKWKELELNFRFYGQKRKRWTSKCNDCLKDRWRNDNRTYDEKRKKTNHKYYKKLRKKKTITNLVLQASSSKRKKIFFHVCKCCNLISWFKSLRINPKCRDCQKLYGNKGKKIHKTIKADCPQCGKESLLSTAGKSICKKCKESNKKKQKKKSKQQRRAASKRVYITPGFDPTALFNRDKWRCKECGKKVKKPNGSNHDNEATVGHIVPISRGGDTTYANCQTECRKCNYTKRDKIYGQQITIFARVDG